MLLDLPDHDSTEVAHRLEVDRLVGLVDVLVWVLDPQKYADAAIHDRYLRPLARHGDVMVVVLNQVDRLAPADVPDAVADVRRLLADDGLPDVPVLAVSATVGTGLDRLRDVLTGAVAAHRAALRRIAADLDTVSATLADVVGGPARDDVDGGAQRALVAALGAAAGIPAVGAAVQRAAVHRAVASTGFPFTRWLRRLRPDPLRRLHLDRARTTAVTAGADDADLVPTSQRTSLPATGAVERSRVELALRRLADDAAAGLPDPWPDAVRDAARSRAGDLADSLDRAVATTDLGVARKPLWWRGFGLLQALLAATAVAGGAVVGRPLRAHRAAAARAGAAAGRDRAAADGAAARRAAGRGAARAAGPRAGRDRRAPAPGTGGGPAAGVRGGRGGEPGAGPGAGGAGGVLVPPRRGGGAPPLIRYRRPLSALTGAGAGAGAKFTVTAS